jgi:hypothetical protein
LDKESNPPEANKNIMGFFTDVREVKECLRMTNKKQTTTDRRLPRRRMGRF